MRSIKRCYQGFSLICVWPMAALAGFGRFPQVFRLGAQAYALVPGLVGDYLRIAYYRLTLTQCDLASCISFGSFFAHPEACVGRGVYIGSYCLLGRTGIGDRTQIASGVQILSGRHQHARNQQGAIMGADYDEFIAVTIGADCWIGAGAIVMADVGSQTTIGAGAVVTKAIPAGVTAMGNPARVRESMPVEKSDE